jgi:hypothetical protein
MTKLNKSWEKQREGTHSPRGVEDLRKNLKAGLRSFYGGIAESMWRYEGMEDDERFDTMLEMSRDTVPEKFLYKHGQSVFFEFRGQIQNLPFKMESVGINLYGNPVQWSPVPIGWDAHRRGQNPIADEVRDLKLDWNNSVIIRNDLFGTSEFTYVNQLIDELVDNTLTMNQLQLLAKSPYVFNVTEDNVLSAKNFFLALSNDEPAIFINYNGERPIPTTELTEAKIDPALFELYDRFECQLLEYIGFPCVPITKRAQQSVAEVESHEMKIYARRQEKLRMREKAIERLNKMFDTNVKVVSVVDERKDVIMQLDDSGKVKSNDEI